MGRMVRGSRDYFVAVSDYLFFFRVAGFVDSLPKNLEDISIS
jgi:hypothetical protein